MSTARPSRLPSSSAVSNSVAMACEQFIFQFPATSILRIVHPSFGM